MAGMTFLTDRERNASAQVQDDIERLPDSNLMVENVIKTLSNISLDHNLHQELISNGLIDVVKKYVQLVLDTALPQN